MSVVKIEDFNSVFLRFEILDSSVYNTIKKHYTYSVPTYKNGTFSMKNVCLIQYDEFLYRGLFNDFVKFLRESEIPYKIEKSLAGKKNQITRKQVELFYDSLNLPFPKRDYQIDAIQKTFNQRDITILSATSSGKSLVMMVIILLYLKVRKGDEKVFLIVPSKTLVNQIYYEMKDAFHDNDKINVDNLVQRVHSDIKTSDLTKPVIISTWQSEKKVSKNVLDSFDNDFLHNVGLLMYDEVQFSTSFINRNIIERCINTDIRVGLTGTLYQEKEMEIKNKTIEGLFGKIFYSVSSSELVDMGYATPVKIYHLVYRLDDTEKIDYREELDYIRSCSELNKRKIKRIGKLAKKGNVLVLYKGLDYGEWMREKIKKLFPDLNVYNINGSVDSKWRENLRVILNSSNSGNVLFGTYSTIGAGYNVKTLKYAVMIDSMKMSTRNIQAVGRLLREHDCKEKTYMIDFVPYFKKGKYRNSVFRHYENRKKSFEFEDFDIETKVFDLRTKCKKAHDL